MSTRNLTALVVILIVAGGFAYLVFFSDTSENDDPEMEFPILEPERVERIAAYRTPDWGEPGVFHNGIDLVISENVTIISPANGTVTRVTENVNPYAGNILFDVMVRINPAWEIHLVLEPGFLDATNNSLQSDNVLVSVNDVLQTGDVVANLLNSGNYPHLHYMLMHRDADVCAYNYSSQSAQVLLCWSRLYSQNSIKSWSYYERIPNLARIFGFDVCNAASGLIIHKHCICLRIIKSHSI
jgi:murein DD-endopeptidase MepM/ murein hydrolase activator NlpD